MAGFDRGLRPNWLEIHLDTLRDNVAAIREHLDRRGGRRSRIAAVVKAEGYGHGAIPIARTALKAGADSLAVAIADEGIALRKEGFDVPILVLGWTPPEMMEAAVDGDLTLTIFSLDDARVLSEVAQRTAATVPVHIKIDTGMSRLGFPPVPAAVDDIVAIASMNGIELEGMFTHFAVADEDHVFTRKQIRHYLRMQNMLSARGLRIPIRHLCNSAAVLDFPDVAFDMVRPGLVMYGVYPSPSVSRSVPVRQFMTWKTRISQIRDIRPGDSVGYGRTYLAAEPVRVATLPVGYADGFSRSLSGGVGEVLIRGRRCPVIGRVCMDQAMVALTDAIAPDVGEEVVLMGSMGGETIDVDEMARRRETIAHEVFTGIGPRVPRILFEGGRAVARAKLLDYGATLLERGGMDR
ncbi:MAG: alanine racemase [Bacillota bacterium]